jgi:hypothetical protein
LVIHALDRVVSLLGGRGVLADIAALGLLLGLLADLRYGRDRRDYQHRKQRRQQH